MQLALSILGFNPGSFNDKGELLMAWNETKRTAGSRSSTLPLFECSEFVFFPARIVPEFIEDNYGFAAYTVTEQVKDAFRR